jgi:drug/metabolite transporter (DMT)-like permease
MRSADAVRLVSLAAIWGASFIFMRMAAPVLGPAATADLRMLIAGLALAAYFQLAGFDPQWRRWWRQYAAIGLLNSGLPFLLWAYAALHLQAGLLSVLNATAPMWGAMLSALFLKETFTRRAAAGLLIGIAGVALVTRPDADVSFQLLPVAAALVAAFCYGLTGIALKRWATQIPAKGLALGTQLSAGIALLPLAVLAPQPGAPTFAACAAVVALGLVSGAVAYVLYFRLIDDIGPTGALTVTYLIPLFGLLFGVLFLGESVGPSSLAGAALVVLGTVLVLRK